MDSPVVFNSSPVTGLKTAFYTKSLQEYVPTTGLLSYRSVGPIQFVSVLSISRKIRSCSAAISTLAMFPYPTRTRPQGACSLRKPFTDANRASECSIGQHQVGQLPVSFRLLQFRKHFASEWIYSPRDREETPFLRHQRTKNPTQIQDSPFNSLVPFPFLATCPFSRDKASCPLLLLPREQKMCTL